MQDSPSFRTLMLAAMEERGISVAELARRSRVSYDAITKLKRREGATTSAENAAAIAAALNFDIDTDANPSHFISYSTETHPPGSFAEPATPYVFREQPAESTDPQAGLRRIFGSRARSPGTMQANFDYPGFNISRGDVLTLDLSRLPNPGEVCVIRIEQEDGSVTSDFRRYLPPYLLDGGTGFTAAPISIDDPRITIRNPVIGLLRGLPGNKE